MELVGALLLLLALAVFFRWAARIRLRSRVHATARELEAVVLHHFLAQPCSKCQEFEMLLISVSPNARSIHVQCTNCNRKMHAPASSEEAFAAAPLYAQLQELLARHDGLHARHPLQVEVVFQTPEAPLPFERTSREPIRENVRSEVWRRDQGRCVECGSNRNLEFDHIIPVAHGGATSARNLQLLCKPCNLRKGARI